MVKLTQFSDVDGSVTSQEREELEQGPRTNVPPFSIHHLSHLAAVAFPEESISSRGPRRGHSTCQAAYAPQSQGSDPVLAVVGQKCLHSAQRSRLAGVISTQPWHLPPSPVML